MTSRQELTQKKCQPCEGIGKPLSKDQVSVLIKNVPQWKLGADGRSISLKLAMKNFVAAVRLINQIAELAEKDNHHPDIHLSGYRNLTVELSTHALGGLSENDFILAAKIDTLPAELKSGAA